MPALFDPDNPQPIHFVGIGGAGMSALALIARRRGIAVTGCDHDTTAFDDLRHAGASVVPDHDVSHLAGARAVIATAAVPDDHPELVAARAAGIPVVRRKEALAELVNGTTLAAIAGTHGKTTTTVMTTEALQAAGLHPTGLAGGRVAAWGGNALLGGDRVAVVEADEYDQAFLTLQPTIAVVNNIEPDHLECYGSVAALENAFAEFAGRADRAIIGMADAGSDRVAGALARPPWRFGVDAGDFALQVLALDPDSSSAALQLPDGRRIDVRLRVPGVHNLRNAAAALAVTFALAADVDAAAAALAAFQGVGRRFERIGEAGGVTLVDDYAHHPTEMTATIAAARQAFPDRRLVVAFQPHLYSRTREHGVAMGRVLAGADVVVVTDVYGARESPQPGISGRIVADAAVDAGACVLYEPARAELAAEVAELLRDGDVLVTMGAGDITRVGPEVRAALASR